MSLLMGIGIIVFILFVIPVLLYLTVVITAKLLGVKL